MAFGCHGVMNVVLGSAASTGFIVTDAKEIFARK
jgi:hypothetical protein